MIGRSGVLNALQIDHKFSIKQGFLNNVAPWVIGHVCNLELIPWEINASKQDKYSITLEELFEQIKEVK